MRQAPERVEAFEEWETFGEDTHEERVDATGATHPNLGHRVLLVRIVHLHVQLWTLEVDLVPLKGERFWQGICRGPHEGVA